jgi:hypothetical protein
MPSDSSVPISLNISILKLTQPFGQHTYIGVLPGIASSRDLTICLGRDFLETHGAL